MLFPNATLFFFVISFLVFMYLLNEWFLKPVGETLEERRRLIADNHEAARNARDQAKILVDNYEISLAGKREEAQSLITIDIGVGQNERNKQLNAVKERGLKRLDQSRETLAAEKTELLEQLIAEETQLVKEIVAKSLGGKTPVDVSFQSVKRALEEAI